MWAAGDKNRLYETVPEKAGARARAGYLASGEGGRGKMLAVSGLAPKDPDPAQLAKLGCMVPAQELARITLRIIALFFLFHKILYLVFEKFIHENCIWGRAECRWELVF